jgi:hypothetical protein
MNSVLRMIIAVGPEGERVEAAVPSRRMISPADHRIESWCPLDALGNRSKRVRVPGSHL